MGQCLAWAWSQMKYPSQAVGLLMTENTNPCSGPEEPGYKQSTTQLERVLRLCGVSALLQHRFTAQTLNPRLHGSQEVAAGAARLRMVLAAQLQHCGSLQVATPCPVPCPRSAPPAPQKGWVIGRWGALSSSVVSSDSSGDQPSLYLPFAQVPLQPQPPAKRPPWPWSPEG